MADDKELMKFDELSSIYRTEISSTSLSTIRKDFYTAVQELIEDQSKKCDILAQENPDSIVYEGAIQRKKNILMNLRKIVEKRMDKIAGMAMRGAMGANNVIDSLTPEEKEYYNAVLEASKVFWKLSEKKRKILVSPDITKVAEPAPAKAAEPVIEKKPVSDDIPLSEIPMDDSPEELPPQEEIAEEEEFDDQEIIPEETVQPEPAAADVPAPAETVPEAVPEKTSNPLEGIPDEENIIIRILEDLPPFSGLEWDYVLRKEDIVRMPAVLAKVLINRGMARLVPTA